MTIDDEIHTNYKPELSRRNAFQSSSSDSICGFTFISQLKNIDRQKNFRISTYSDCSQSLAASDDHWRRKDKKKYWSTNKEAEKTHECRA